MERGIKKGYLSFNEANYEDEDNFYVRKPHLFLGLLTGKEWEVQQANPSYKADKDDYLVEFWSLNNGKTGHFTRIKQRNLNTLESSNTVKNGEIYSYRIFKVVK